MISRDGPFLIVGPALAIILLIVAAFAYCGHRTGPTGCRNTVRVLSWLHMGETACAHPSHDMTLERVGLKVVMRCTCKAKP